MQPSVNLFRLQTFIWLFTCLHLNKYRKVVLCFSIFKRQFHCTLFNGDIVPQSVCEVILGISTRGQHRLWVFGVYINCLSSKDKAWNVERYDVLVAAQRHFRFQHYLVEHFWHLIQKPYHFHAKRVVTTETLDSR